MLNEMKSRFSARKIRTLLVFLFLIGKLVGQNLVPNGDFEQYWHCPNNISQMDSAKYWTSLGGTADYFNHCDSFGYVGVPWNQWGFQQAHSGVAYAGIILWFPPYPNFREYIQTPFSSVNGPSLLNNTCYHFEMYVNLANDCIVSTSNIGVYFSDTLVTGTMINGLLPVVSQINNPITTYPDSANWTLISGDYIAHGGESYLIIGNFSYDSTTSLLYVSTSPTGWNMPLIYIDDVSLTQVSCTVGISELPQSPDLTLYPNPATDKLTVNSEQLTIKEIHIYNVLGLMVNDKWLMVNGQSATNNQYTLNINQLPSGIYFLEAITDKGIVRKRFVKQ